MEKVLVCQSCGIPIEKDEIIGTFTDGISTLEEYIEYSLQFAEQAGITKEEMKEDCKKVLPTLKRWKQNKEL